MNKQELMEILPHRNSMLLLDEATALAKKIAKKDSVCLLSPAASSYDHFKNFEVRGDYFRKLVAE